MNCQGGFVFVASPKKKNVVHGFRYRYRRLKAARPFLRHKSTPIYILALAFSFFPLLLFVSLFAYTCLPQALCGCMAVSLLILSPAILFLSLL